LVGMVPTQTLFPTYRTNQIWRKMFDPHTASPTVTNIRPTSVPQLHPIAESA
jgi:hypothetical protein